MVALNFNKRFAEAVESGQKRQTVRREWSNGKFPFHPGVKLQLYTGQRTRYCRKLGEAVCTRTTAISIDDHGVMLGGRPLTPDETYDFARRDGFRNTDDMLDWFGDEFDGWVVEWTPE